MSRSPIQEVAHHHLDYVNDVAFDYYGRRIATCSSDRTIKIWAQAADGAWQETAKWKAHDGNVWRVTFAHPEFGQILASCSSDRNVLIWEEQEGVDSDGRVVSKWLARAQLSDARQSVNEIKFAPRHMGLKIATGSADGRVRVYEATDATSLAHWSFSDEFAAESGDGGVSCLAWTTSPFDAAMMVVGGGSGVAKVRAAVAKGGGRRAGLVGSPPRDARLALVSRLALLLRCLSRVAAPRVRRGVLLPEGVLRAASRSRRTRRPLEAARSGRRGHCTQHPLAITTTPVAT